MPVSLVASNAQLKNLAAWRPSSPEAIAAVPEIRAWQVARYGSEWLEFIAGFEHRTSEQRAEAEDRPPSSRRRRRRRRRKRSDGGGESGGEGT